MRVYNDEEYQYYLNKVNKDVASLTEGSSNMGQHLYATFVALVGENLHACGPISPEVSSAMSNCIKFAENGDSNLSLDVIMNAISCLSGKGYVSNEDYVWVYRANNGGAIPEIVEDIATVLYEGDAEGGYNGDFEEELEDFFSGEQGSEVTDDVYSYDEPEEDVEDEGVDEEVAEEVAEKVDDNEDIEDQELVDGGEIYLSFIRNKVIELLETYEELYKACYEGNRPKGILTPEGLFTLNGKVQGLNEESRAELSIVYNTIEGILGKLDGVTRFSSRVSPKELISGDGMLLLPMYHLANMYGYFGGRSTKSKSFKEFKDYIEKRTVNVLKKIVNNLPKEEKSSRIEVEDLILDYIASIKTCILVDDYQPGVILKLRISVDSARYPAQYNAIQSGPFQSILDSGYLFRRNATIDIPARVNDVVYLNFIVDAKTYFNAPLFAYESLPIIKEQGIDLSWNNMLIGKDTKDKLVFGHFGAQQKTIYNILAGSGSGKGVMTLNLLASALASDMPVMYADCKPDMAKTLWEVAGGREVLAFDGDDEGTLDAVENRINIYSWFNTEVPEELRDYIANKGLQKKFVKAYSYLRCMHLAYLISVMRKEKGVKHDDYILFIFDEIGRLSERIMQLTLAFRGEGDTPKSGFIYDRTVELKNQGMKKEEIARDPSIRYATDFINYALGVVAKIVDAKTAELRLSNSKLLFIWQPDWLEKGRLANITSKNNPYYFLSVIYKLASDDNTVKFAGKGANVSYPVGMSEAYNKSAMNAQLFDEYRYFAMSDSGTITESSTVFRPFLLLNNSSVDEAQKVCATNPLAVSKVYKDGNESGEVIPEIGFPAYVNKLLDGNVQDPLCRSWSMALEALEDLGYEPDIYKFMYDVSDLRINISKGVNTFDSTTESNAVEEEEPNNYSSVLKRMMREDDFFDEDTENDIEEAAMRNVFDDYEDDDFSKIYKSLDRGDIDFDEDLDMDAEIDLDDLGSVGIKNNNTDVELSPQFIATVNEAETLINKLKELGVEVEIKSSNRRKVNVPPTETDDDIYNFNAESTRQATKNMGRVDRRAEINIPKDLDLIANPAEAYDYLSTYITKDIVKTFGGTKNIRTIAFTGGAIAVNKKYYRCSISRDNLEIPYEYRRKINSGNIAELFYMPALLKFPNLNSIVCDDADFWLNFVSPVASSFSENVTGMSDVANDSRALFRAIPSLKWVMVEKVRLVRESIDEDLESWESAMNWARKKSKIGDSIQANCFKGATKSWGFTKRMFTSDKNLFVKSLGVVAGTTATAASGMAGIGVATTRKIKGGIQNFAKGIKNLMDN